MNENLLFMDENRLRQTLVFLEQDKQDLQKKLSNLCSVIKRYELELSRHKVHQPHINDNPVQSENHNVNIDSQIKHNNRQESIDITNDQNVENQIICLLTKNNKATKLPYIQNLFDTEAGNSNKLIAPIVRRMKTEGKLVAAKYNNSNKLTFWGLPEWVEKDGTESKNYKGEYRPDQEHLPDSINTIKFLD